MAMNPMHQSPSPNLSESCTLSLWSPTCWKDILARTWVEIEFVIATSFGTPAAALPLLVAGSTRRPNLEFRPACVCHGVPRSFVFQEPETVNKLKATMTHSPFKLCKPAPRVFSLV